MNCSFITRDESNASGVALISVDALGENHIVVAPGANHSLSKLQINQALSAVTKDTLVLLQLEIPLSCVSYAIELANSAKCRVILDPAPAQDLPRGLFEGLFLITPNETEAETLTGITINNVDDAKRAANKLLSFGVRNVAITLGKQGVLLSNADQCEIIKAPSVHAIDTTAAGDCFNGALACALAMGQAAAGGSSFCLQSGCDFRNPSRSSEFNAY